MIDLQYDHLSSAALINVTGLADANAAHAQTDSLRELLANAQGDTAIKTVIVVDIGGTLGAPGRSTVEDAYADELGWLRDLAEFEKPVIAVLDGPVSAAGFGLAAASDFVLCSPDARFSATGRPQPAANTLMVSLLSARSGPTRAKEIMMSGRTIAADEAIELGIVYRILDSDRLLDEALNLAKSFRDTGEAALKTIKKQFRRLRSADSSVPDGAVVERQIRAVMNRYCRGVDRGDIDLIKSTYWDDAYDDHGSFKGSPKDFAEAVTTRMDGVGLVGQHHVTNMTVVLDGDIARVEAYYLAFTPEFDHQSGEAVIKLIIGRYLDRYEKRCGEWRVANRLTLVDWAQPYQDGTPWNRSDLFTRGDRREADPSHLFLR